jgi:hypothetical protein
LAACFKNLELRHKVWPIRRAVFPERLGRLSIAH